MTFHLTNSKGGSIELIASWGHGKPRPADWLNDNDIIIADDDDGHYDAWRYEGDPKAAALKIASFFRDRSETYLITFDGRYISWVPRDDWADGVEVVTVDTDGEPIDWDYHPERHPNGLCMS